VSFGPGAEADKTAPDGVRSFLAERPLIRRRFCRVSSGAPTKAIAITTLPTTAALADVPTVAESGRDLTLRHARARRAAKPCQRCCCEAAQGGEPRSTTRAPARRWSISASTWWIVCPRSLALCV